MTDARFRQLQRTGLGAALVIPPAIILTAPLYVELTVENAFALPGPYLGLVGILVKSMWGSTAQDEKEPPQNGDANDD